jgi:hypothetical protein
MHRDGCTASFPDHFLQRALPEAVYTKYQQKVRHSTWFPHLARYKLHKLVICVVVEVSQCDLSDSTVPTAAVVVERALVALCLRRPTTVLLMQC